MSFDFTPPDRIYSQYKNKLKMKLWLRSNHNTFSTLLSNITEIHKILDYSKATGNMLDLLGEIVCVPRPIIKIGNPPVKYQFREEGISFSSSSTFVSADSIGFSLADDDVYRKIIQCKIFKDNTVPNVDSIIFAVGIITDTECLVHEDVLSYSIEFKSEISELEKYIFENFNVIPKPAGVSFLGFNQQAAN